MGESKENDAYEEELLDYEEEEEKVPHAVVGANVNGEAVKKGYVGIHMQFKIQRLRLETRALTCHRGVRI